MGSTSRENRNQKDCGRPPEGLRTGPKGAAVLRPSGVAASVCLLSMTFLLGASRLALFTFEIHASIRWNWDPFSAWGAPVSGVSRYQQSETCNAWREYFLQQGRVPKTNERGSRFTLQLDIHELSVVRAKLGNNIMKWNFLEWPFDFMKISQNRNHVFLLRSTFVISNVDQ